MVTCKPNSNFLWEEISQQGEKLWENLEIEIDKAIEAINEELSNLIIHWKLITFGIIVFVLLIIIGPIFCFKSSKKWRFLTIPIKTIPTFLSNQGEQKIPLNQINIDGSDSFQYDPNCILPETSSPYQSRMSKNRDNL